MMDLYAVLGLSSSATEVEIRKATKQLLRMHHPDKNPGNAKSEARAKEINRAYTVLTDPRLRALYDEFGAAGLRTGFDAAKARATARKNGPNPAASGASSASSASAPASPGKKATPRKLALGSLAMIAQPSIAPPKSGFDVLNSLLGKQRVNAPGDDCATQIDISFAEAVRGVTIQLENAAGRTVATFVVPPGAQDGTVQCVADLGAPSPTGGPNGDLFVTLRVAQHPVFKRQGEDLHAEIPVSVAEAYAGARISVPTPVGEVAVRLPPRTQTGTVLRVRGKGLPCRERGSATRGDLLVRILVHIPLGDGAAEWVQRLSKYEDASGLRADVRL